MEGEEKTIRTMHLVAALSHNNVKSPFPSSSRPRAHALGIYVTPDAIPPRPISLASPLLGTQLAIRYQLRCLYYDTYTKTPPSEITGITHWTISRLTIVPFSIASSRCDDGNGASNPSPSPPPPTPPGPTMYTSGRGRYERGFGGDLSPAPPILVRLTRANMRHP